ncbi:MAG: phosphotransferase family protein [Parasphingopyxis sp.]|uniref:phosphotransferase family protein n=1 Tax=Parasphingopyxis sp. TaxID=1920299 RepID=UPI0032EF59FB
MERDLLSEGLVARLESRTGAAIADIVPRGGGGASRQGAEVTLRWPDGETKRCYLAYDTRAKDPRRMPFFEREVAVLAALSGPLTDCGVRVPRLVAYDAEELALLTELVPGHDAFQRIEDADQREALVRDFVNQLAALHAVDIGAHPLGGFGDPAIPVRERMLANIVKWREDNLERAPDPVLQLAYNWLEDNLPENDVAPALVHGDAGVGNFMIDGDEVTALLDWELTHYGDPMEDLAQIWVRMLFQPFAKPSEIFRLYEEASGRPVDVERVKYLRLYFQLSFTTNSQALLSDPEAPEPAALGTTLLFATTHMRVIVEQMAELSGTELPDPNVPDAPPGEAERTYDIVLKDLKDIIVPRIEDQQASAKAKALARTVKWWKGRDRCGAAFREAELAELEQALGKRPAGLVEGRAALARKIADRAIAFEEALALCHSRVMRDTETMGDALGRYRTTYFPPLD